MTDDFDPYYTWLGIPPEEQPATHYRLLGIRPFESNLDVISNAADQRMAFLRTFQVGKRSALSQRLLNEMAAAKVCLLDADRRKAYDDKLKATQPQPVAPAPQIAALSAPTFSPPSPVLVPSRQAPVARPMPVAARLPSRTPDPFASTDPFADAAREVQAQPVLPAKPPAAASDDYSDQVVALVRAAVSRVQESPLATAAYGVLALGIVMLLSVGLWITFGRGTPPTIANVPPPANSFPGSPPVESFRSSKAVASPLKTERQESPTRSAKTDTAESASSESSQPDLSPTSSAAPVESSPAASPEASSKPLYASSKTSPATIYNVLPGKFPLPRVARLSSTAAKLAEFGVGSRVVKVWATDPAQKAAEPLSITTPRNVRSVGISRNDEFLAIGTDDSVEVWDLRTRKNWKVPLPGPGVNVVFCNNDLFLAVACEGTKGLGVIDINKKYMVHRYHVASADIRSQATGDKWLAALASDGQISLYDLEAQKYLGKLLHPQGLPFTAVHMRGKELFAFDNQCMTGWNPQELKQISEWSDTSFRSRPQPDVFDVLTGYFIQQENGTLDLFQSTNNSPPLARIGDFGGGFAIVDIAVDRLLTSGPDDRLLVWDLERLKENKAKIDPREAIAAWAGAKDFARSTNISGSLPPLATRPVEEGPLEAVDPAVALDALRALGLQGLPNRPDEVTYLNFSGSKASDADAKYVLAFPQLESLYCEGSPFTGKALRYFQNVPALKALTLNGSKSIGDDDLAHLSKASNLENLGLRETAVTSAGIAHLKSLTKLRSLYLPEQLGRDCVPALSELQSLQDLSPFPQDLTDGDLAQLSRLIHLRTLDLQRTKLTPAGYKHLDKFQEATSVSLNYMCPREALPSLKNLPLQHLYFPGTATDQDVEIFAAMSSLRTVFLNGNMSDKAVAALGKFSQLEMVGIGSSRLMTDEGLAPLQQLKALKELFLHEHAGDAAARIVAKIPSLRQLHLAYNGPITDDGIEALGALPQLTVLSLPQQTSDRSCEIAGKMKELQILELHGKAITPAGLRKLGSLNKLNMLGIYKQLSADDVAALKELKRIKTLMLHRTGLTDEAVANLAKALPNVSVHAYK